MNENDMNKTLDDFAELLVLWGVERLGEQATAKECEDLVYDLLEEVGHRVRGVLRNRFGEPN